MAQYQPPETSSAQRPQEDQGASFAQKAETTARRLEDTALDKLHETRAQLKSGIEGQRTQAGERIKRIGDVLRKTGQEVSGEDEFVGRYLNEASDRIDRFASYVTSASVQEVQRDASRFAKRKPLFFYGGSLLLGMAAGRLLKMATGTAQTSSETESDEDSWTLDTTIESQSGPPATVVSPDYEGMRSQSTQSPSQTRLP